MDTDQLADADFARACELSSDLRELVEEESCTQGKLMDALLTGAAVDGLPDALLRWARFDAAGMLTGVFA